MMVTSVYNVACIKSICTYVDLCIRLHVSVHYYCSHRFLSLLSMVGLLFNHEFNIFHLVLQYV